MSRGLGARRSDLPTASKGTDRRVCIREARTLGDRMAVMTMLRRLARELSVTPESQRFGRVMSALPHDGIPGDDGLALLALDADEAVGCIVTERTSDRTRALRWCYVRDELRRTGIGAALLREILRRASAGSASAITATTPARSGAYPALLQQHGFRVQRLIDDTGSLKFVRLLGTEAPAVPHPAAARSTGR